ncbi:unnamed protein product, partial [Meganyctiphanes norvegica]
MPIYKYNNIGPFVPLPPKLGDQIYDPDCIQQIEAISKHIMSIEQEFFSGACYSCGTMISKENDVYLWRCSGCQLVSYCSKRCQKADWKMMHKFLCKTFPLENGKNVIVRYTDSIREDRDKVYDALDQLQKAIPEFHKVRVCYPPVKCTYGIDGKDNLFKNARICNVCHEARPELLHDCLCCAVSYCSKEHRIE